MTQNLDMLSYLLGLAADAAFLGERYDVDTGGQAGLTPLSSTSSEPEAAHLSARLDALELACAGMWKLLRERGLKDDDLVQAMREIDEADGKADGRIRRTVASCPKCKRAMLTRRGRVCLWCGEELPTTAFGMPDATQ
jgi:hypothetical protein